MLVNKFAGRCENCGDPVQEGDGFVNLIGDDWVLRCTPCITATRSSSPTMMKCVECYQMKRPHLLNEMSVCVDCA